MSPLIINVLLISTFFMGVISALTSMGLLIYFRKTRQPLGFAVAFMLFGEFVASGTMCLFAWAEIAGGLPLASPILSSILRLLSFSVVTASTIHLALQIHRVLYPDD